MVHTPQNLFDPCSLGEDEQIPAKIWELLRRNCDFLKFVDRLTKLDGKERDEYKKSGKYHGTAWQESSQLLQRVAAQHPFAGVALQWLVPEPLFHCNVAVRPLGKKWKLRPAFAIPYSRIGVGTTPNVNAKDWVWRNPKKLFTGGHPMVRGPEIHWTKSRFKLLRSCINPILEWKRYPWPFTVKHSWPESPAQFRRDFLFIWRKGFDCRPQNPLTNDRRDSPAPYEITFFQDWKLSDFRASGQGANFTKKEFYQILRFNDLAADYRAFAVPKTILTKGSAEAMGKWLATELKRGSILYGDLLKEELLDESELLGLSTEWNDWLAHEAKRDVGRYKSAYFYRRCRYMASLVAHIFPQFNLAELLAKPTHRDRGKTYYRKGRNE